MPLYDYECEACGKVFEDFILKSTDEEPQTCKHCGSEKISRKIGAAHHKWTNKRWTGQIEKLSQHKKKES